MRLLAAILLLPLSASLAVAQSGEEPASAAANQPAAAPSPATPGAPPRPGAARPGVAQSRDSDGYAECMAMWSPLGTRMSKQEWSGTCERTRMQPRK